MKSSTIRRSNLSKEKIAVLEALSKFNGSNNDNNNNVINDSGINTEPVDDMSPEVYIRRNKEKELDILWKDFKMPKGENSPIIYLGIGFVAGIIATIVVSAFIGISSGDFHPSFGIKTSDNAVEVSIPEDSSAVVENNESNSEIVNSSEETVEPEAKSKKFGLFGSKKTNEEAAAESAAQSNKEYEVQSGDTMEQIVRNFYGGYSEEKVNAIMKANNMTNPNKLSIGQKLIIPAVSTTTAE